MAYYTLSILCRPKIIICPCTWPIMFCMVTRRIWTFHVPCFWTVVWHGDLCKNPLIYICTSHVVFSRSYYSTNSTALSEQPPEVKMVCYYYRQNHRLWNIFPFVFPKRKRRARGTYRGRMLQYCLCIYFTFYNFNILKRFKNLDSSESVWNRFMRIDLLKISLSNNIIILFTYRLQYIIIHCGQLIKLWCNVLIYSRLPIM